MISIWQKKTKFKGIGSTGRLIQSHLVRNASNAIWSHQRSPLTEPHLQPDMPDKTACNPICLIKLLAILNACKWICLMKLLGQALFSFAVDMPASSAFSIFHQHSVDLQNSSTVHIWCIYTYMLVNSSNCRRNFALKSPL